MDFKLSSEHRMIQESIQALLARDVMPIVNSYPKDKPLPKEAVKKIGRLCAPLGLTSARLPEEAGGAGVNALTFGIMREQLPPTVGFICGGFETTAVRIYYGGTPEQKEKYIPRLINGDLIGCTGATEPDSGSDPRSIRTRAVLDGDHYVINGHKSWISNASICELVMVVCAVGKDDRGNSELIRILVDREESPFETRKTPTMGLRQGHLGEMTFENCRVPAANAIGAQGEGSKVLHQTWLLQRPVMGLYAVRMAERALEAALKYAGERVMFGRKIGGFQLVQELLADIAAAVTTSRLLCYYALDSIDRGENGQHLSAMAKRYAINTCTRAISLAMEVHGAMGIADETGLEELYRDVRMLPIPDGTNQIMTLIEGRALTGISAIRG